jgi:hypothetical protein
MHVLAKFKFKNYQFVFSIEARLVPCDVRTKAVYKMYINFLLQRGNRVYYI